MLRFVNNTAHIVELEGSTADFVAVMPQNMYKYESIYQMIQNTRLRGILILSNDELSKFGPIPTDFSPLTKDQYGELFKSDYSWLSNGSGLQRLRIPCPLVSISTASSLKQQTLTYANERRLSSGSAARHYARLNYYMSSTKSTSSSDCLGKRTCQPLGGYSAWASFGDFNSNKTWILAPATLDSHSMFPSLTLGSRSTITPLVTWLGAAQALGNNTWLQDPSVHSNVVFAGFNGETWSHAGSRRFLADLKKFECYQGFDDTVTQARGCMNPFRVNQYHLDLNAEKLSSVVELHSQKSKNVYTHIDASNVESQDLRDKLQEIANQAIPDEVVHTDMKPSTVPSLPPLISAVFNKPAVIISDYDTSMDPWMGSMYDDADNVGRDRGYNHLCSLATIYARTLAHAAGQGATPTDDKVQSIQANCAYVFKLAECLLQNVNCDLVKSSSAAYVNYAGPASTFSGVYRPVFESAIRGMPKLVFDLLSKDVKSSKLLANPKLTEADLASSRFAYYHDAIAPEFTLDHAKDVFQVDRSHGPGLAWTSSNYGTDVGVLLYDSEDQQVVLALGISAVSLCLFSGLVGIMIMKKLNTYYDV